MAQATLIQGDCLEVMSALAAASVDLVLCDLPYGTTACRWDSVIPFGPLWAEYDRVCMEEAPVALFASQPFTSALGSSNIDRLRYSWTWRKSRPTGQMNAKRMPLKDAEDILVFCRVAPPYFPQGLEPCGVVQRNTSARASKTPVSRNGGQLAAVDYVRVATAYPRQVLDFPSVHNVGALHPTQKPVPLLEYLIRTYTNEGDTVLDNTMGSGSTGVACMNTGRNFIGIERDPAYFAIAEKRIEGAQKMPDQSHLFSQTSSKPTSDRMSVGE